MRKLLILAGLLVLLGAAPSFAQSPVNPTRITFDVSLDHNVVVGTVPVVDHYEFVTVSAANNGVLVFTQQLGKPTAANGGNVGMLIPGFGTLANGVYQAKVVVVGPGGQSETPLSSPFGRIGAPAGAGSLVILQ